VRPEQMDEVFRGRADIVGASRRRRDRRGGANGEMLAAIEGLPGREREALLLSAMEELKHGGDWRGVGQERVECAVAAVFARGRGCASGMDE